MQKIRPRSIRWWLKYTAFLLLGVMLYFTAYAQSAEKPLILLLSSQESMPYSQTITAFKERLAQYLPQAQFMYHKTDSAASTDSFVFLSRDMKIPPTMIFSLGTKATEAAQTIFPDSPLLATMILQEEMLAHKKNNIGILLQFPIDVQLQWLRKFLPQMKRVGILYDPIQNSDLIREAEEAARRQKITIIPYEVTSAKQLQAGLKYINRNADVLLGIPDQTVYSGKTAKEILLFSYRNRIPFVGLSSSWVKAGALYAIEVEYNDLGRQAAEFAYKMLQEDTPAKATFFRPEKISYSLNLRTKDYLLLDVDPDLITGASQVFE